MIKLVRSPLRVRRINVIFCRHPRMALVSTLSVAAIRRKCVGSGIVEKLGICPPERVRESPAILFDERHRFQCVRYHHEIGGTPYSFSPATRSSQPWSRRGTACRQREGRPCKRPSSRDL